MHIHKEIFFPLYANGDSVNFFLMISDKYPGHAILKANNCLISW
jgi:hypothetical protein